MNRFRNILLVVPGRAEGQQALAAADRLAATNEATLTIFDSVEPVRASRSGSIGSYRAEDIQQLIVEARRADLDELAAHADSPVSVDVSTGPAFLEVIRRVIEHSHDLVIIAPDQQDGARGLARASTTMHLLRKCPVPVLVHRHDVAATNDVLAAVGPFPHGRSTDLDETILALGTSLADRLSGRLHVIHAWDLAGESLLRNGKRHLPKPEVDTLLLEERALAQLEVEKLLIGAGLYNDDVTLHLVAGDPAESVVRSAETLRPEVVVMGTLARSGIAGLLIGNTAESVLVDLNASVLAVKPDEFVTPVAI